MAHARQIRRQVAGREVTSGQIMMFGRSSGLMPCPAALTMLLVCLRLKRIILGRRARHGVQPRVAVTLGMLGVVALLGMRHAARRLPGFDRVMMGAPYVSCALVICVGVFMGVSGFLSLPAGA